MDTISLLLYIYFNLLSKPYQNPPQIPRAIFTFTISPYMEIYTIYSINIYIYIHLMSYEAMSGHHDVTIVHTISTSESVHEL